jgi:hypothetical protein
MMQTLGTDWGRKLIDENLWVEAAFGIIGQDKEHNWVFDDVRFLNEYEAIRRAGGEVWKVVRPTTTLTSPHESEGRLEQVKFDVIVENISSLADFKQTLQMTLIQRKRKH